MLGESATISSVCRDCDVPKAEGLSLNTEQKPKYQLCADNESGYNRCDWLQAHALAPDVDVALSPEFCEETFNYLILSGDRMSQMTQTYHDIDAVAFLLAEKEKDLELAAHVGQGLLERNREIVLKNGQLKEQLASSLEEVSQLHYEITLKQDLLHTYELEESDSSYASSPVKDVRNFGRAGMTSHIETLQAKMRKLENVNAQLKLDQHEYKIQNEKLESKEQKIVSDTFNELDKLRKELVEVRKNNSFMNEDLSRRTDETFQQQEEISRLLAQIVSMQRALKQLALENEELQQHLTAANQTQYELTGEIQALRDCHQEVSNMLEETKEEAVYLRNHTKYLGLSVPYSESLASELGFGSNVFEHFHLQGLYIHDSRNTSTTSRLSLPSCAVDERKMVEEPLKLKSTEEKDIASTDVVSEAKPECADTLSQAELQTTELTESTKNQLESVDQEQDISISLPPLLSRLSKSSCIHLSSDRASHSGFATPHLGRPGIPGTEDLQRAIRKLSLKRTNKAFSADCKNGVNEPRSCGNQMPLSCPDSPTSVKEQKPGRKLRIIKPLEGSVTLNQWKLLAERERMLPDLQVMFKTTSGIITRDRIVAARSKKCSVENVPSTKFQDSLPTPVNSCECHPKSAILPVDSNLRSKSSAPLTKSLTDIERFEFATISPGKGFAQTTTRNTFTDSRVKNPTKPSSPGKEMQSTDCCNTHTTSDRLTMLSSRPFVTGPVVDSKAMQGEKSLQDDALTCSRLCDSGNISKDGASDCGTSTCSVESSANTLPIGGSHLSSRNHVVRNRNLRRKSFPSASLPFNFNRRTSSEHPEISSTNLLQPSTPPPSSTFLLNQVIAEESQSEEEAENPKFSSNLLRKLSQIGWAGLQRFQATKSSADPVSPVAENSTSVQSVNVTQPSGAKSGQVSLQETAIKSSNPVWAELHASCGETSVVEEAESERIDEGYLDEAEETHASGFSLGEGNRNSQAL